MKFYIASSFANKESVVFVREELKKRGFSHTYDWTLNNRVSSIEQLTAIGELERQAVLDADIVLVLLPAGKGSHVEMGIALGHGKKVYLFSPTDEVNAFETTSTFYHLPEVQIVIGTLQDLIELVEKVEISLKG
ncbi:nucleoside 2-deoxyribosyltransferase [Planococcus shixiaomingii]|uniref:nucleoside 2-deoxyribosyltransferase n=1 Tax=Planococcus shixiaomingii TaxID=3058393 RepID=UPI00262DBCF9|nr:nucleoside 2-deoxyribosyltransferase [Planococcus sp. N022]WKA56070.1 nucleoside 2-deoxyribosyltransferase [Planococcus sp. N022]